MDIYETNLWANFLSLEYIDITTFNGSFCIFNVSTASHCDHLIAVMSLDQSLGPPLGPPLGHPLGYLLGHIHEDDTEFISCAARSL